MQLITSESVMITHNFIWDKHSKHKREEKLIKDERNICCEKIYWKMSKMFPTKAIEPAYYFQTIVLSMKYRFMFQVYHPFYNYIYI